MASVTDDLIPYPCLPAPVAEAYRRAVSRTTQDTAESICASLRRSEAAGTGTRRSIARLRQRLEKLSGSGAQPVVPATCKRCFACSDAEYTLLLAAWLRAKASRQASVPEPRAAIMSPANKFPLPCDTPNVPYFNLWPNDFPPIHEHVCPIIRGFYRLAFTGAPETMPGPGPEVKLASSKHLRRVGQEGIVRYNKRWYRVCNALTGKIIRVHKCGDTIKAECNGRFGYHMTWVGEANP